MGREIRRNARVLVLGAALGVLGIGVLAGHSGAAARSCASFKAQADAQDYFLEQGGSPRRHVGSLDGDHNGVACEGLTGPYKGFATIGYNRKKQFLYGVATMPPKADSEEFACLYGNRHFPDAPRKVNVFRVRPGADKALLGEWTGAVEARPESGRLLWKADRANLISGRYYVSFEERVSLTPYGRSQCPGFSSRPTLLPRPRHSASPRHRSAP
ncbi:MAG: excalibur calcium-binding domain-containing protein [Solirubrobacterales bacterium]